MRRKRARARQNVRTFMLRVRACVLGSLQKWCWLLFTIFWSLVSNFIKIGALVAEIFAKQYWHVCNPSFSMYFANFPVFAPPKLFEMDNWPMIIEFFGNHISKCPSIRGKRTPGQAHTIFSSLNRKQILFITDYFTPCTSQRGSWMWSKNDQLSWKDSKYF